MGPDELSIRLKAAGEGSRLRLLALCAEREYSVTELATALGQSEPRVSRHLSILCRAGLLSRERNGQWVYYRVPSTDAATLIRTLLAQLDPTSRVLVRDKERASSARKASHAAQPVESRLGRELCAFVRSTAAESRAGDRRLRQLLIIGASHLELIEHAASLSDRCIVMAESRRAAQVVRAWAERREVKCTVLIGRTASSLVSGSAVLDAVIINHAGVDAATLAHELTKALSLLSTHGRLWLFERYEALESSRERVVEHPLSRLRRLLRESGFV